MQRDGLASLLVLGQPPVAHKVGRCRDEVPEHHDELHGHLHLGDNVVAERPELARAGYFVVDDVRDEP